jgi:hypothetical protein
VGGAIILDQHRLSSIGIPYTNQSGMSRSDGTALTQADQCKGLDHCALPLASLPHHPASAAAAVNHLQFPILISRLRDCAILRNCERS